MNRITTGRVLIGLSLTLGTIGSTVIDNFPQPIGHMSAVQTWPPHALFHDAAFFLLLDGITAICLWLLFRRSREPLLGALIATLVVFVYWTPFFYITTLYPQASLVPTSPVGMPYKLSNFDQWDPMIRSATPVLLGYPVHAQILVATVWMSIALAGYWLCRRGTRAGDNDSRLIA